MFSLLSTIRNYFNRQNNKTSDFISTQTPDTDRDTARLMQRLYDTTREDITGEKLRRLMESLVIKYDVLSKSPDALYNPAMQDYNDWLTIYLLIVESGLTVKEIAKQANIDHHHLKYLLYTYSTLPIDIATKLAQLFKVPVTAIHSKLEGKSYV